jgi:hypothetical protein
VNFILFNQNAGTGTLALQPELKLDSIWQLSLLSPFSYQFSNKKKPVFPYSDKDSTALSDWVFESQLHAAFRRGSFAFQPILKSDTTSFFGLPDKNYNLDDYTRFNSLEEVFREYIPDVEVQKNKGNYKLFVNNLPYKTFFKDDHYFGGWYSRSRYRQGNGFSPQQVKISVWLPIDIILPD